MFYFTDLCRILIVDWDVHHGQGTQYIFEEDPRFEGYFILYVSQLNIACFCRVRFLIFLKLESYKILFLLF